MAHCPKLMPKRRVRIYCRTTEAERASAPSIPPSPTARLPPGEKERNLAEPASSGSRTEKVGRPTQRVERWLAGQARCPLAQPRTKRGDRPCRQTAASPFH